MTKSRHIYKIAQAQARQQTFVKDGCLQTLPKPLDTIKINSFDKSTSTLGLAVLEQDLDIIINMAAVVRADKHR